MSHTAAEKVLREIESDPNNYLIVGRVKGQILVRIAREFQPRRILEIGTNLGYSAILMGKELDSRSHITTIEIDPKIAEQARENIQRAALAPKIDVVAGDAREILPNLNGEFDFVFIDADKDQYYSYLQAIEDKLYRGSLIVSDNVGKYSDRMKDFLDHIRSSGNYTSRTILIGDDGVELSIKR